jgi:L-lysine 4-chlorinase
VSNLSDVPITIDNHLNLWQRDVTVMERNKFARDGFIKVRNIVSDEIRDAVRDEVLRLLGDHAERRDLYLETTGNTPRFMSVVKSEIITAESELIDAIYNSECLLDVLAGLTGEKLYACPSKDEELLITLQERKADTHGWHWGDFSFALIWIIESPPLSHGGMLQCVPHTFWDKSEPRIHEYLCENPIATYSFDSGDIYLLRTDTTLHRTVPLTVDSTRIILNMTWAAAKDLGWAPDSDDRWWERSQARAAKQVQ